mmetsp:Transcript_13025/g.37859  ORF Transcript_13025/g.37859 Transcript_13025/m.37859 type:complete len:240 (-) Transcript_13025:317-1036(-)
MRPPPLTPAWYLLPADPGITNGPDWPDSYSQLSCGKRARAESLLTARVSPLLLACRSKASGNEALAGMPTAAAAAAAALAASPGGMTLTLDCRSSSGVCAKKHILRVHLMPSLHICVRYLHAITSAEARSICGCVACGTGYNDTHLGEKFLKVLFLCKNRSGGHPPPSLANRLEHLVGQQAGARCATVHCPHLDWQCLGKLVRILPKHPTIQSSPDQETFVWHLKSSRCRQFTSQLQNG